MVSHQAGAFVGSSVGGLVIDLYGSLDIAWIMAIIISLFSAIIHFPIIEKENQKKSLLKKLKINPLFILIMGALMIAFSPIFVRLSDVDPIMTAFYRIFLSFPSFFFFLLSK